MITMITCYLPDNLQKHQLIDLPHPFLQQHHHDHFSSSRATVFFSPNPLAPLFSILHVFERILYCNYTHTLSDCINAPTNLSIPAHLPHLGSNSPPLQSKPLSCISTYNGSHYYVFTARLGAKRDFEVWTYDAENSTHIKCLRLNVLNVYIKCLSRCGAYQGLLQLELVWSLAVIN